MRDGTALSGTACEKPAAQANNPRQIAEKQLSFMEFHCGATRKAHLKEYQTPISVEICTGTIVGRAILPGNLARSRLSGGATAFVRSLTPARPRRFATHEPRSRLQNSYKIGTRSQLAAA